MRKAFGVRRGFGLLAAALAIAVPAEAYYHYIYFRNGVSIRAAFDVSALPNHTLTFFVSDSGPSTYAPNDSMGSILGELKQAIAAWNSVSTSNLRVAFGGMESLSQNPGTTQNTPAGDIVFQDLGPGLLGMATPNLPVNPTNFQTGPNGQFVPIQRSTVILTSDTSIYPGPSNTQDYFTTAVHEIGHALGLQHTWTGAAMSQDVIRTTTRTRPIDADDRAAMTLLYGSKGWTSGFGTIAGHVTFGNGQPAVMASVVAIPPSGPAVSALTDPNGNYEIDGIPSGTYLLYAHPLPPDAVPASGEGILPPLDASGNKIAPSASAFRTVFYPGTIDWTQAQYFTVEAGKSFAANFSVSAQASVTVYDVETLGYVDFATRDYIMGNLTANYAWMSPAFINITQSQVRIGLAYSPFVVPASVGILGSFAPATGFCGRYSPCFTSGDGTADLIAYLNPTLGAGTGQRHLVLRFANDVYVLPGGVNLVQNGPPYVDSATPNADGTVTIAGTGLNSSSKVYFDSLPANGAFDTKAQTITVTPPPGTNGQVASITAYNSDGQNSYWLQQGNLPTYTYPVIGSPSFTIDTPSLRVPTAQGATMMVDITGVNTQFVDGRVTVGFGSSDIAVSRVWVKSPTHLIANVVVAPNAAVGTSELSVISGAQVMTQPSGFQVLPADPAAPAIVVALNGIPTQASIYPGGAVTLWGINMAGAQIEFNGSSIQPFFSNSDQVNFFVPQATPTGVATLKLTTATGRTNLAIAITNPPPTITGITDAAGGLVDASHAAGQGSVLNIQVAGLDATVLQDPSRVKVMVGTASMTVLADQMTATQIPFSLDPSVGSGPVQVTVVVDGNASNAWTILTQ
jgi:hypothetical protein